jgi:hypothetical protein
VRASVTEIFPFATPISNFFHFQLIFPRVFPWGKSEFLPFQPEFPEEKSAFSIERKRSDIISYGGFS